MTITPAIRAKFLNILNSLSPENLTCDGELSTAQVNARYRQLKSEWKALETSVGRKISEDEAATW